MTNKVYDTPSERLQRALYDKSFKRVKRRGMNDDQAARVARVVAERSITRSQTPDIKSDKDLAVVVASVCKSLVDGRSFYDLIGEKPYLATGRIDRLVAAARHVKPPVGEQIAATARKIAKLERLSGAVAVLFMAVALTTLGFWPALGTGVAVAAAGEIYVQTAMPAPVRLAAARGRVPYIAGAVAVAALAYFGYEWVTDVGHQYLYGAGLVVAALFAAFIVPGLTLAFLVGLRERRWRRGLEKRLVQALKAGASDLPDIEEDGGAD